MQWPRGWNSNILTHEAEQKYAQALWPARKQGAESIKPEVAAGRAEQQSAEAWAGSSPGAEGPGAEL